MIEQFDFSTLTSTPYFLAAVLIFAFFIGFFIGKSVKNNKYKSELEKCLLEKSVLVNNARSEAISFSEDNTIKAVQTRGRSGMAMESDMNVSLKKKTKVPPKLDFNSIGHANEEAKDDLKLIEGIGPFIEKKLNSIGIYKFEQLSRITDKDIEVITELIEFFPGRIKRDDWKGKATQLLN
ncbi:hypothetical protein OOZ15_18850 [Galbibacter sp. EGI 63066]|uniref:hypothetical protein n=1 Tax=Galbibacter sp. EGI 63066 TaxID=2993559 RepID=UPI0022489258|nr:hypothetical protein [Galbibacter sp. EGI 63066]MCX2682018.1 hypothetical protein [Galbibacter sp. EGI 63066]